MLLTAPIGTVDRFPAESRAPRPNQLDKTEQCCGVCLPTSLFGRIGVMLVRLDDLPAVPARDGATSSFTPNGISGPLYGVQKLPVAGGRAGAMLFRAGGPVWRSACGNWRLPLVAGRGPPMFPATRVTASSV